MKPFAMITGCLFLSLLLPNTGFGGHIPWYYVNGANGNDNNTCTEASQPCKTIKAALEKVSHGAALIKIAQGIYEEQGMDISANQHITFEGGWNNTFTSHTCKAGGTTIIAGDYQGFGSAFLTIYLHDNGDSATMDIQCLTLQPAATSGYPKVISIITSQGATAQLNMDHARVTGFTGDPVVALTAQTNNASTTATVTRTTFDKNRATGAVISLSADTGSTAELNINKVWLKNNINTSYYDSLAIGSRNSGVTKTSITNSVLAANDGGIMLHSRDQSSNSITVSNCTFTDNPRFEMKFIAWNTSTISMTVTNSILKNNDPRWSDLLLHARDMAKITFNADYSILGAHEIEELDTSTITFTSNDEVHGDPLLNSTYHLQKGSPAIDAGICGEWINIWGHYYYDRIAPVDDIDGDKRPGDWTLVGCDIGADEFKPFPWPMFLPAIVHQRLNPYTILRHPKF